jgi:hypothetical protein
MALDANQIETLRIAIGDALTFDDLDLILQKCFGSARIHDVASATLPRRIIAQKCIELVEQEKLTVVFARFVLTSAQSTPALQQALIAVFPELNSINQPFSSIVVSATNGLASNAQQIATQVGGTTAIQELADLIAELKCYKALHEAIHQIKLNAYPIVPVDDDPAELQGFWRELRKYLALLRTNRIKADDALNELPAQSAVRVTERPWVTMLGNCAAQIQAALTQNDIAAAEIAIDVAARTIDPLLDQINKHIHGIANRLPLDRLLDALRGQGQPAVADAIAALRVMLLTRVVEHSRWQEADNALFSLDQTFKLPAVTAFKKFARQWPPARKQIQNLTGVETAGNWLNEFQGLAGKVDHALAELERSIAVPAPSGRDDMFNASMFDPFEAFRLEAQTRFFTVDSALKTNCVELLRIRTPLGTMGAIL